MNPYLLLDPHPEPKLAYFYRQNILQLKHWPEVPHAVHKPPIEVHIITKNWIVGSKEITGKILVFFDDEAIEMHTLAKKVLINRHGVLQLLFNNNYQPRYEQEIRAKFGKLLGKYDDVTIAHKIIQAIANWRPPALPPVDVLKAVLTFWGTATDTHEESKPVDMVFKSGRAIGNVNVFYGIFELQPFFAVAHLEPIDLGSHKQYKQIVEIFTDAEAAALHAAKASVIEQQGYTHHKNIMPQSDQYIRGFIYDLKSKIAELLYKSPPNIHSRGQQ